MGKALSAAFVVAIALTACATYRDQLVRAQSSFEQNQHERTLALLRDLEPDYAAHLEVPQQAQYAYLRGMTDYRMGYKADARHWLAIALSYDEQSPGMLPADWKARSTDALNEMNGVVQTQGYEALNSPQR